MLQDCFNRWIGVVFYKEFAHENEFEIRKATTEQSKNEDGCSCMYILCNGERRKGSVNLIV